MPVDVSSGSARLMKTRRCTYRNARRIATRALGAQDRLLRVENAVDRERSATMRVEVPRGGA
jgi:hypothetical protein